VLMESGKGEKGAGICRGRKGDKLFINLGRGYKEVASANIRGESFVKEMVIKREVRRESTLAQLRAGRNWRRKGVQSRILRT